MKRFSNFSLLLSAIWAIGVLWQMLEKALDGAVQPSTADTIITVVWVLVVILAYLKGKRDQKDDDTLWWRDGGGSFASQFGKQYRDPEDNIVYEYTPTENDCTEPQGPDDWDKWDPWDGPL